MTLSVINLALDEDEARFILSLMAYGSAALGMDIFETMVRRAQLETNMRTLTADRANALIVRQVKLMRVAFPDTEIQQVPAADGTTLPE